MKILSDNVSALLKQILSFVANRPKLRTLQHHLSTSLSVTRFTQKPGIAEENLNADIFWWIRCFGAAATPPFIQLALTEPLLSDSEEDDPPPKCGDCLLDELKQIELRDGATYFVVDWLCDTPQEELSSALSSQAKNKCEIWFWVQGWFPILKLFYCILLTMHQNYSLLDFHTLSVK